MMAASNLPDCAWLVQFWQVLLDVIAGICLMEYILSKCEEPYNATA